jgi:hypothetical protein
VSFPEPPAAADYNGDLTYLSALADYIDAAGDAAKKARGLRQVAIARLHGNGVLSRRIAEAARINDSLVPRLARGEKR